MRNDFNIGITLVALLCVASLLGTSVLAATLPPHKPLSILIIADEVNPHRLSDAELTQPQDLAPALTAADSPLGVAHISTVDSQCADAALASLTAERGPQVVLYFAHRAALHCDGSDAQVELTQLLDDGLHQGLGIVVLHHGLYVDIFKQGAKDDLLALLGAKANSIAWDTRQGQRVYNVGGSQFVSSNGLVYPEQGSFAGVAGVPAGNYPYFTNLPDELYSDTVLIEVAGETRTPLFATDSQGERLLGYVLSRPGWSGRVVAWQPAEYQPNALDDRKGPNFQILVNALYYAAYGDDYYR